MTFFVEQEVEAAFDFDVQAVGQAVAEAVLEHEHCPLETSVELTLTDDAGIQEMNREFREIDAPTDVLSFPNLDFDAPADYTGAVDKDPFGCKDPDTGEVPLGDIVINVNRVESQAREYGHSRKREFAFLVAHSMLHLSGYDHMEPEEARDMEQRQEEVLQSLNITRDLT